MDLCPHILAHISDPLRVEEDRGLKKVLMAGRIHPCLVPLRDGSVISGPSSYFKLILLTALSPEPPVGPSACSIFERSWTSPSASLSPSPLSLYSWQYTSYHFIWAPTLTSVPLGRTPFKPCQAYTPAQKDNGIRSVVPDCFRFLTQESGIILLCPPTEGDM